MHSVSVKYFVTLLAVQLHTLRCQFIRYTSPKQMRSNSPAVNPSFMKVVMFSFVEHVLKRCLFNFKDILEFFCVMLY